MTINRTQHAKMDLNTKSLPKQKTIETLTVITQGFKITLYENPHSKFWFPQPGIEPGPLD